MRLDNKHAWTTSYLATFEMHTHKKDSDLQVGNILTLEGGTGKAFYKEVPGSPIPRIFNIGLVYYGQFKVSGDTGAGPAATAVLEQAKDRVFGVGGEASALFPKSKLFLDLRVVPEFGARDRTQGITFLVSIAYQVKSLMKPTPGG